MGVSEGAGGGGERGREKGGGMGEKKEGGGVGGREVGEMEVGKGGNEPSNCSECRTIFDKDKRFGEQTGEQSFNDPGQRLCFNSFGSVPNICLNDQGGLTVEAWWFDALAAHWSTPVLPIGQLPTMNRHTRPLGLFASKL